MEIVDLDRENTNKTTAIGLGNFDGVHLGHQKLIKTVVELAEDKNLIPSLLLFKDDKNFNESKQKLSSLEDKLKIVEKLGIELVFLVSFNKEFKSLTAENFIKSFLVEKCKSKLVVVGKDYTFAYKAQGNSTLLKKLAEKFSIQTNIIDYVYYDKKAISSTQIRNFIKAGEVEKAKELLDRPYSIEGEVIKGFGRGKSLGYPTANLLTTYPYLIPEDGVYYTIVDYKGKFFDSMTSIGNNPTFSGREKTIEIFIDDFNEDIYGEKLKLFFINYLRPMYTFSSIDDLVLQLDSDYDRIIELSNLYNLNR